jgi:hypothetical protein
LIVPTICNGLSCSIAVRKRAPGELGDWLEGVVTLCLLTREKEEFKELEGSRFGI